MNCQRLGKFIQKLSHMRTTKSKQYTTQSKDYYDVIISGGGMVGTAMAAALAHEPMLENHRILLLESGEPKTLKSLPENFSSRVCALSPGAVNLLKSFKAWQSISDMRYKEVKRMQKAHVESSPHPEWHADSLWDFNVWDSCSESMITLNHEDLAEDLAFIVENDVILTAITEQVKKVAEKVETRINTRVKRYHLPTAGNQKLSNAACVELEDGSICSARLLIGADGFKSLLRETAGFHTVGWDYNQMAVVATLKLAEEGENSVAWQRFMPSGPVAMLPLSNDYSCLIWSTTPADAKNLLNLPEESFVDAVNNAFWSDSSLNPAADYVSKVLDNILTTVGLDGSTSQQLPPTVLGVGKDSRAMFPLGLSHSSHYVKSRVALIGDAAHRVHPLAGQGVNLGFGDVARLRDCIAKAVYNGQDIGSLNHLLEYETARQRFVIPTMAAVDGLNRLYSNSWTPLVLLRSLGLQATNALKPVKNFMIQHATS